MIEYSYVLFQFLLPCNAVNQQPFKEYYIYIYVCIYMYVYGFIMTYSFPPPSYFTTQFFYDHQP